MTDKPIPGLECVLLIDDDKATNFIHEMEIRKLGKNIEVVVCLNGHEALDYLSCKGKFSNNKRYPRPGLILLDINMPIVDGWEFLKHYKNLPQAQLGKIVIMMVSASTNPSDEVRATTDDTVSGFMTKTLTRKQLEQIVHAHFAY